MLNKKEDVKQDKNLKCKQRCIKINKWLKKINSKNQIKNRNIKKVKPLILTLRCLQNQKAREDKKKETKILVIQITYLIR